MIVPPVERDALRIGHGNLYAGNKKPATAVAWINRLKCDSFGANEATKFSQRLNGMSVYNAYEADYGFSDMSDARDCITVVKKAHRTFHHSVTQASIDVPPAKLGHDRVITSVAYKKSTFPGQAIAHINIHPNPINHLNPTERPPLVDEYIKNMNKLYDTMFFLEQLGYRMIVTGDFNITQAKARERGYLTPYRLATRFNLNALGFGVDGILWDKSLRMFRKATVPMSLTGADHMWFYLDFKNA